VTVTVAVAVGPRYEELSRDWPLLQPALAGVGLSASTARWSDPGIDWAAFDLVVAHGAWDNIHDPDGFGRWVDRVARETKLVNSQRILHWNQDKRYLDALARAGVPTVPTAWIESRGPLVDLPAGPFVVKPTISGGGYLTARYHPEASAGDDAAAREHIDQLLGGGRVAMIQPYLDDIDQQGETALIYLGGHYSHAIGKSSLLRPGEAAGEGLWRNEVITPGVEPTPAQRTTAELALAAAERQVGPATYARVDLVPLSDGSPAVLELELLDPALFFDCHPPAAAAFAAVLARMLP
jgi:glutathione synthase/RimK-type ligase-like ATP-grasp enzyme